MIHFSMSRERIGDIPEVEGKVVNLVFVLWHILPEIWQAETLFLLYHQKSRRFEVCCQNIRVYISVTVENAVAQISIVHGLLSFWNHHGCFLFVCICYSNLVKAKLFLQYSLMWRFFFLIFKVVSFGVSVFNHSYTFLLKLKEVGV